MRKQTRLLTLATLIGLLTLSAQAQNVRIGVIDLDRAFNEFYKTKLADVQLKDQAEDFNDERQQLVDEYEALQETFNTVRDEAQNRALSEEVRNEKRNEAEEKLLELREYENKIRRFDQGRKKQLDDQSKRMRTRIVGEIQETLDDYARSSGFSLIVDYSGQSLNGVPTILYYDNKVDVTDQVIALINQERTVDAEE